jgi:PAS domain S-box-containing protein
LTGSSIFIMTNTVKHIITYLRQRTITGDLSTGLILSTSVILLILGLLNYYLTFSRMTDELTSQVTNTSQKMANILSVPIWNFDNATIEKIGESFQQPDNAIRILDENGMILFDSQTENKELVSSASPIYYNNHQIGTVEISLSKKEMNNLLNNIFLFTLLTIILTVLTLQLVTSLLLHRFLNHPLSVLIRGLDTIASGKDYHSLAPVVQTDMNKIIQGVNFMAQQIDERVEALRQSEERFRQVVTSISDMVYLSEISPDDTGINRYISQCAETLTGYPSDCFLKDWNLWASLIQPDDSAAAEQQWQRLMEGKSCEREYRLVKRDQEVIWVRDSARVVISNGTRMVYGVVSDITERKRVEESLRAETAERKLIEAELIKYQGHLEELVSARTAELESLNKELESFAYSISHDLRAPLRHIDGFSFALLEDLEGQIPEQALSYLQRIRKGTRQMNELIDGLLRLSRINRQPLTLKKVDPQEIIAPLLGTMIAEQNERQIDIHLGLLPSCQADPVLLRQVYTNLISNAIKYTRKQVRAVIEIGSTEQNDIPVYYVGDNGVGFDMNFAGKLFGVFQRLHSEAEFEGNGIGLAIVQRIIHRHGGQIWAESVVGQGSTFYFTLPASSED